jgi:prepilin-type N-terminal cleavage/methylation domain-containing protein
VRKRLRVDQDGFGLIELLIAMVILNVGLLAIIASFQAGIISLSRASRVTTAAVLADQQMELYRAIT